MTTPEPAPNQPSILVESDYEAILQPDEHAAYMAIRELFRTKLKGMLGAMRGSHLVAADGQISPHVVARIEDALKTQSYETGLPMEYLQLLSMVGGSESASLAKRMMEEVILPADKIGYLRQQILHYCTDVLTHVGGAESFELLLRMRAHPNRKISLKGKMYARALYTRGVPHPKDEAEVQARNAAFDQEFPLT